MVNFLDDFNRAQSRLSGRLAPKKKSTTPSRRTPNTRYEPRRVDEATPKATGRREVQPKSEPRSEPRNDAGQTRKIKSGETLSQIALDAGITTAELARYNNISDPSRIFAGQDIKIPPKQTDTLPRREDEDIPQVTVRRGVQPRSEPLTPEERESMDRIQPQTEEERQQQIIEENRSKEIVDGPREVQTYTVKSGDNLSRIAAMHDTTWQEIARANNIQNPNLIKPGLQLMIPVNRSLDGYKDAVARQADLSIKESFDKSQEKLRDVIDTDEEVGESLYEKEETQTAETIIDESRNENDNAVQQVQDNVDETIRNELSKIEEAELDLRSASNKRLLEIQTEIDDGYERLQRLKDAKANLRQDLIDQGGGNISRSLLTAMVSVRSSYINNDINSVIGEIENAQRKYQAEGERTKQLLEQFGLKFEGLREVSDGVWRAFYRSGSSVFSVKAFGLKDQPQGNKGQFKAFGDKLYHLSTDENGNVVSRVIAQDESGFEIENIRTLGNRLYQLRKNADGTITPVLLAENPSVGGSGPLLRTVGDNLYQLTPGEGGLLDPNLIVEGPQGEKIPTYEQVLSVVDSIRSTDEGVLNDWANKYSAIAEELGFNFTERGIPFFDIGPNISDSEYDAIKSFIRIAVEKAKQNTDRGATFRAAVLDLYGLGN